MTESPMTVRWVFKVLAADEWRAAAEAGRYAGSADDRRDGFVHLSSASQVRGTLDKHFAGRTGLVLLQIDTAALGPALRWEPSRGGAHFPHLYGVLPSGAVSAVRPLAHDAAGRHVIPELE